MLNGQNDSAPGKNADLKDYNKYKDGTKINITAFANGWRSGPEASPVPKLRTKRLED